jgi:glycosyltransferase involved in cell wall biosynthesis
MKMMRILQGLTDIAGQAGLLAKALRALGHTSESWVFGQHPFGYSNDRVIIQNSNSSAWTNRIRLSSLTLEALLRFDIWHLHRGTSFFSKNRDLAIAKALGKKIVFHYRGREVRPMIGMKELDATTRARLEEQLKYADLVLVHDGELANLIKCIWPSPIVFPNIVDISNNTILSNFNNKKLHIVHIPSNPTIKGTEFIREAVKALSDDVDYTELTGIPHDEVIKHYSNADLVIDQLLIGTYGNASLEAMALGKPVMCYLNEDLDQYHPHDLPIIRVSVHTLISELKKAVNNREWLREVGEKGLQYILNNHTPKTVAEKAISYYMAII